MEKVYGSEVCITVQTRKKKKHRAHGKQMHGGVIATVSVRLIKLIYLNNYVLNETFLQSFVNSTIST